MMPVIDSIDVAAIAMPYRPAHQYETKIATQTAITGHAVDFIDTPRPAMMLVAWPVVDAGATCCTGLKSVAGVVLGDDDHRRRQHQPDQRRADRAAAATARGSPRPMSPIIHRVMNQKPIAEITPATIRPRYSAFMILPPVRALTK